MDKINPRWKRFIISVFIGLAISGVFSYYILYDFAVYGLGLLYEPIYPMSYLEYLKSESIGLEIVIWAIGTAIIWPLISFFSWVAERTK